MKHVQTDKYTIAWFKIAECVSRGEKERALGVYRLLSHSFNDDAVARQLEADIYLSCGEQDRAIELYRDAIALYDKAHRYLEATAVLEHVSLLLSDDMQLKYDLITHYGYLYNSDKALHYCTIVLHESSESERNECIEKLIASCTKGSDYSVHIKMLQALIRCMHGIKEYSVCMVFCLEKIVDKIMQREYEGCMHEFFSTLKAIDQDLYEYACSYIKQ